MNKKIMAGLAAALTLSAAGCYKDFDFTADAKADHEYIDINGDWWSADTGTMVFDGQPGDIPVPADWGADNNWDRAVVRPNGDWVTNSSAGTIHFPAPAQLPAFVTDDPYDYNILPVPGDYDGDGTVDAAWYRDSDGTWFVDGLAPIVFGSGPPPTMFGYSKDQDFPVPADYDGDKITDLATFNARTKVWKVLKSTTFTVSSVVMPGNEFLALPVPADYDNVGHAQRATVGPDGWVIEGHASPDTFGQGEVYYPAVADYDSDKKADFSYTDGSNNWITKSPATTLAGPVDGYSPDSYPIETGYNLATNFSRLNLYGRCDVAPQFCE